MQYRLIDTVSAAYPAQGPANYLLYIFCSVVTLLLQSAKGAMTLTNCIFTRDGT